MDPQSRVLLEQTHLSLIDAIETTGHPILPNTGV